MKTAFNFFTFNIIILSCNAFLFGGPTRQQLKLEILDLASETNRGLTASAAEQQKMNDLFEKLERLNPTKKPLKSNLVNGVWSLQYTTSESIIGKGKIGSKVGDILQVIDTNSLYAENSEVVKYFGIIKVPRKVTAELFPQSDQLTNVQFKKFSLGPVAFDAPESFKGYLDVTYVDNDLRLTRGDKGNIFVLTKKK
jgi:hypothetical protein